MTQANERALQRRLGELSTRDSRAEGEVVNAVRDLEETIATAALAIVDAIYKARY